MLLLALWRVREGWSVVAQFPIGPFRADLAIPEARLVLEVDGVVGHGTREQQERDERRSVVLRRAGWTVWRCRAGDAFLQAGDIARHIAAAVRPEPTDDELWGAIEEDLRRRAAEPESFGAR